MRTTFWILVACLGLTGPGARVAAHHSFAVDYDAKKPVAVTGVVMKVEWTNPHIHIYVDAMDPKGVVTSWNFEMTSPNYMERNGWSRKAVNPGDKVTIQGFGGRVVMTRAIVEKFTLPDGRVFFEAGGREQ